MQKINNKIKIQTSKALAVLCAKLSSEKIAGDILVIDLVEYPTAPADYFVICSSNSPNQSKAILELILRKTKSAGIKKPKVEGEEPGEWILIDFFDVVVHVMLSSVREYYTLEKVWESGCFYRVNEETGRLNKIK